MADLERRAHGHCAAPNTEEDRIVKIPPRPADKAQHGELETLEDLDFTTPVPLPPITNAQAMALTEDVEIGSSELRTKGFFVTVPRSGAHAPLTASKPVIIIIDDDESVCNILETYLGDNGFETRSAGNRAAIMRELGRRPLPDLILCDVQMPDANGFDLLHKFRQSKVLGSVPVVMLTAHGEKDDIIRGLSLGAAGYITKPARLGVVKDAVRKLLMS